MKRGFTLIELLVVVLIIGILAAVALPQYEKAVQKSRNTQLKQAVRATAAAQEIYKMANGVVASSFEDLDIGWGLESLSANPCSLRVSGENIHSLRHGKDFYIVLNNDASTPETGSIVAVWKSGKYTCTGFSYNLYTKEFLCIEAANGRANISEGDFCLKIENASRTNNGNGWRHYTMP